MLREFRFALVGGMAGDGGAGGGDPASGRRNLLLKKGYACTMCCWSRLITAAIMLVRSFRTPPATFMQAAGEFKALAGIGTNTSVDFRSPSPWPSC